MQPSLPKPKPLIWSKCSLKQIRLATAQPIFSCAKKRAHDVLQEDEWDLICWNNNQKLFSPAQVLLGDNRVHTDWELRPGLWSQQGTNLPHRQAVSQCWVPLCFTVLGQAWGLSWMDHKHYFSCCALQKKGKKKRTASKNAKALGTMTFSKATIQTKNRKGTVTEIPCSLIWETLAHTVSDQHGLHMFSFIPHLFLRRCNSTMKAEIWEVWT